MECESIYSGENSVFYSLDLLEVLVKWLNLPYLISLNFLDNW